MSFRGKCVKSVPFRDAQLGTIVFIFIFQKKALFLWLNTCLPITHQLGSKVHGNLWRVSIYTVCMNFEAKIKSVMRSKKLQFHRSVWYFFGLVDLDFGQLLSRNVTATYLHRWRKLLTWLLDSPLFLCQKDGRKVGQMFRLLWSSGANKMLGQTSLEGFTKNSSQQ